MPSGSFPTAVGASKDDCTVLDPTLRTHDAGRTLLGGSPLRLLRVTDAGAEIVRTLRRTGRVDDPERAAPLLRRLIDTGMVHPQPAPREPADFDFAIVIPARNEAAGVSSLVAWTNGAPLVVVDDGSDDPEALGSVVNRQANVTLLRHQTSKGPAAARNAGWRSVDAEFIVFLDADVTPHEDWLAATLGHFADPEVAAVAPRVEAAERNSTLARYEGVRSPLDLGESPGRVAPRTRISYVPTAALIVRRDVLEELDGFDESLRVGEDVDLLWRIVDAGRSIRYEPRATVSHRNRSSWPELLRQRFTYATAAARLDERHPGQVAPADVNITSLISWALPAIFGKRGLALGTLVAAGSAAALVPKLEGRVDEPVTEAARLGGLGHLFAGRLLASATARAWFPLLLPFALISRRLRRTLIIALVAPAAATWFDDRPDLDPLRFIVAHIADDLAYCAGLWRGAVDVGSFRALLPRLSGIAGVTGNAADRPE